MRSILRLTGLLGVVATGLLLMATGAGERATALASPAVDSAPSVSTAQQVEARPAAVHVPLRGPALPPREPVPTTAAARAADAHGEAVEILVRGAVVDPGGNCVSGASVVAALEGPRTYRIEYARTDADGTFAIPFAAVAADEDRLSLRILGRVGSGCPPLLRTFRRDATGVLELGSFALEEPLAVRGLLRGDVLDWEGWDVHGTSLVDRVPGVRTRWSRVDVAADGSFELTGFPSGDVLVEATHPFHFGKLSTTVPAGSSGVTLDYTGPTASRSIAVACPDAGWTDPLAAYACREGLQVAGLLTKKGDVPTFVFEDLEPGPWSVVVLTGGEETHRFEELRPGRRRVAHRLAGGGCFTD